MKAVAETGYVEDFYDRSQYESLEYAIVQESKDL